MSIKRVSCRAATAAALIVAAWASAAAQASGEIVVIRRPHAEPPVLRAAEELARRVGHLCNVDVDIAGDVEGIAVHTRLVVAVGQADGFPVERIPAEVETLRAEGYAIETTRLKNKPAHLICGRDSKGTLNGTYGFVELLCNKLLGYGEADIDFEFQRGAISTGQAAELELHERSEPFYPWRGAYLHNLEMGVADLLELPDGFRHTAEVWKDWVDWLARHKGNYVVIWPYNSGFNWWEYVLPGRESLRGLAPYSDPQIARAIEIRKELFRYAQDRGIRVFIGSYVPGGAVEHYQKVLTQRGLCGRGPLAFSMCLSMPGTFDLYRDIVREVLETYPEVAGLHYRWWAESGGCFCAQCEAARREAGEPWPQMKKLLRALVDTAVESAPDKTIIISGYRRASGDVAYAQAMPRNVVFECKWGWGGPQDSSFFYGGSDWEPTPHHNVPETWIKRMARPLLIDHRLTTECSIPVGVDQSWQLQAGISDAARKARQLPAIQGFPLIATHQDYGWVTGIQFQTLFRLNWAPGTDVTALVRDHFHNHYSAEAADDLTEALRLDGAGWSHFVSRMFWLRKYRFVGWDLNPDWLWVMPERLRTRAVDEVGRLREDAERALTLCDRACLSLRPDAGERFWDFRCQLAIRCHFYEAVLALLRALEALRAGDSESYQRQVEASADHHRKVLVHLDRKPYQITDNQFDGNPMWPDRFREDRVQLIRELERMIAGEKVFVAPKPLPTRERLSFRDALHRTVHQGQECYQLRRGTPDGRLRIGVNADHAFFVDRDFLLEIHYYDDGKAAAGIDIEYDSHLDGPIPDLGNAHRRVSMKPAGRSGWQRVLVRLDQCRFADRQPDNCDLTLIATGDGPVHIKSVRLLEMEEGAQGEAQP